MAGSTPNNNNNKYDGWQQYPLKQCYYCVALITKSTPLTIHNNTNQPTKIETNELFIILGYCYQWTNAISIMQHKCLGRLEIIVFLPTHSHRYICITEFYSKFKFNKWLKQSIFLMKQTHTDIVPIRYWSLLYSGLSSRPKILNNCINKISIKQPKWEIVSLIIKDTNTD